MSYPGYPYPGAPGGPPYQQPGAGYPPPAGYPYQPNTAPYPPQQGAYPPQHGAYPPQQGAYPPPTQYPPQGGAYPQPNQGYMPPAGYPQPGYGAGYPPPQQQGGYYPPPANYPPPSASYPHPNVESQAQAQSYRPSEVAPHEEEGEEFVSTPTVYPADPFDPAADAEILRKAMKGFGTDEKSIISVLARRTNDQRQAIAAQFKTLYGKDLLKDLKSETSGRFKDLLKALMTPIPLMYANCLHNAMTGGGTDEDVLIEVLCTKYNDEIREIREAYEKTYHSNLEDDLMSETSGTFRRVLVSMCNASRDESMRANLEAARADAGKLLEAGEMQWGTDESTFNMILCQRNFAQLQLIFDEYEKISGRDIEDTIKSEFSGDSEDAFLAIVRSIRDPAYFFAKCLHNAVANLGTDDDRLIRIVAIRCELDMEEIKTAYREEYEESLADAISSDTSGHYKKCLLALIGEK